MLLSEFQTLTGIYPTAALWEQIDKAYLASEMDKHEWCDKYKRNVNGYAELIARSADTAARKAEEVARKEKAELIATVHLKDNAIDDLRERLEKLREQLDKELEWKPSENCGTNLSQNDYEELAGSAGTRALSDLEAMQNLHELFGFDMALIRIVENVQTYEVNKHRRLRVKDEYSRRPLWGSSDWNYIRFECAGCQWECIDSALQPYYD